MLYNFPLSKPDGQKNTMQSFSSPLQGFQTKSTPWSKPRRTKQDDEQY